jgi:hypothetical protein
VAHPRWRPRGGIGGSVSVTIIPVASCGPLLVITRVVRLAARTGLALSESQGQIVR